MRSRTSGPPGILLQPDGQQIPLADKGSINGLEMFGIYRLDTFLSTVISDN